MNESKTTLMPIAGAGQALSIGATSAPSAALPQGTQAVRVQSTADCFISIGDGVVAAVTTGLFLGAGIPEYFTARPGWVIAAIQSAIPGSLYISPMV